jgi:hypothetical protein
MQKEGMRPHQQLYFVKINGGRGRGKREEENAERGKRGRERVRGAVCIWSATCIVH